MHRVEEKMSVYQREHPSPMHTCQGLRKKVGNLGMSVGKCTGIVHAAQGTHKKSKHLCKPSTEKELKNPQAMH